LAILLDSRKRTRLKQSTLDPFSKQEINNMNKEIDQLLASEEVMWKQKKKFPQRRRSKVSSIHRLQLEEEERGKTRTRMEGSLV
jgi:hypothetical protein